MMDATVEAKPIPPRRDSTRSPRGIRVLGVTLDDFDRWVVENQIPDEELPEAFARWLAEQTGGPVPRFEKVEPGDEQILPPREQRELDALPSGLDRET